MRILLLLLIISSPGFAQQEGYQAKLSERLQQIRALGIFNNSVVVYDESTAYGSDFPLWNHAMDYYEGDHVLINAKMYEAKLHSKGHNPGNSINEWQLISESYPYLFLRDSAKTEDLNVLLTSDHPYIRTYCFAALAYRGHNGLFQMVVDQLHDTTLITQLTGHVGSDLYPADLMLSYSFDSFTKAQKSELTKLIRSTYPHLQFNKNRFTN